jgi:hypothetical protein
MAYLVFATCHITRWALPKKKTFFCFFFTINAGAPSSLKGYWIWTWKIWANSRGLHLMLERKVGVVGAALEFTLVFMWWGRCVLYLYSRKEEYHTQKSNQTNMMCALLLFIYLFLGSWGAEPIVSTSSMDDGCQLMTERGTQIWKIKKHTHRTIK